MPESGSAGDRFRKALTEERPLQIAGTSNALVALMARQIGFRAIYLSGAGVANLSFGLPDLGVTTLDNVLEDARRITGTVDLPLLVDVDTGFGAELMIARTVREMMRAGVAAIHMEDQVGDKRCGHRPGKALVSEQEMVARIRAAVDARTERGFVIMARTDAVAVEGLDRALERAAAYAQAGADMIFPEALGKLEQYRLFKEATGLPVLANLTEFGLTPLFTRSELAGAGVDMALYPLSASRAMNSAATAVLERNTRAGDAGGGGGGRCMTGWSSTIFWATKRRNGSRDMAEYERKFADVKKVGGLAGIVAADSAICTVGIEGRGLSYRGYSIEDLAAHAGFEEVAWLLLRGELPAPAELAEYRQKLQKAAAAAACSLPGAERDPSRGQHDGHPANCRLPAGQPRAGAGRDVLANGGQAAGRASIRCPAAPWQGPARERGYAGRLLPPRAARTACPRKTCAGAWMCRSSCTRSTSSTRPRSRRASSSARCQTFTPPWPGPSAPLRDRCTAARTRRP